MKKQVIVYVDVPEFVGTVNLEGDLTLNDVIEEAITLPEFVYIDVEGRDDVEVQCEWSGVTCRDMPS